MKGEKGNVKLYEVNRQIEELLGRLEPDPETGEIPADEEEIIARINELAIAREDILTYLAKLFLNGKAMLQSLRAEEIRLKDRSQKMARKQDRLLSILDRECGGEKTDLGVATLFYRTNKHVEVTDAEAAVEWLKKKGYSECYRIPKPEIYKANVGKLLDDGEEIPGVERVSTTSCYLK
jgi:phage host-nuclease inhibitor protein Gam